MCNYRSGEAVFDPATRTVVLKTIEGGDSHTKIRQAHGIREVRNDLMDRYHTPVEYIPTLLDFTTWEGWKLQWDAGEPEWADTEIEAEIIRQFREVISRDNLGQWGGNLYLGSLTAIPAGVTLSAGGDLYLNSLTAIPEGVTLSAGGYLSLGSLTAIPEGVTLSAGGYLSLGSLTAIPEGVTVKAMRITYRKE